MPHSAWRFSLRALLIAAALVPPGAYFWLVMPTRHAQQFTDAVNRRDFAATERLCIDRQHPFPGRWQRHDVFEPTAVLVPLTWYDVCLGQRQVELTIAYGDGRSLAAVIVDCQATARGIYVHLP